MPEAHEQVEHAEHIEHAAGTNKKIALVIAVMALFRAQTEAMNLNIKSSDLWNFFQAKTIRRTVVLTAAEAKKAEATAAEEVQAREPIAQQIGQWEKTAARYRSEPETGEGTVELSERAKAAEHTATPSSRSTTITSSLPQHSRSASCCARRPSSPVWRCSPGSPVVSRSSASASWASAWSRRICSISGESERAKAAAPPRRPAALIIRARASP
jgi:hypothetical protein